MKKYSRSILAGFGLFAAAATCMAQANLGGGETVRINDYPGVGNPLARVVVAKQLCEKYGLKCTLQTIPGAPLVLQALIGGSIDVGGAAAEVGMQAAAKGADLKVLGNALRDTNFFLVANNTVNLPNLAKGYPAVMADLKGKKIGVTARGSGAELQFVELLAGAGMANTDVTFVAVGAPDTAYPALTNNQVDAVLSFEPLAAFCEVLKTCRMVVDMRRGEGSAELRKLNGAAAPLWIRAQYAKEKPQVIEALRRAFTDAETFYQDPANFDEVLKIHQQYFKLNQPQGDKILAAAIKASVPAAVFKLDKVALQANADHLLNKKQLPQRFDTTTLLLDPR
ncbi:ABC transporter substrate-binding protein [Variovorax sp. dw_954]|uniref:ABC transporter substrate-binding protein n=1 Tax=Variovorax sp. dw_954 TaxID=2720078 RepID=UPI001BD5F749|nr:ABC transporter substrate-binding protein [Variovorax sp. dw_954]